MFAPILMLTRFDFNALICKFVNINVHGAGAIRAVYVIKYFVIDTNMFPISVVMKRHLGERWVLHMHGACIFESTTNNEF